jgi:hypothetical protein
MNLLNVKDAAELIERIGVNAAETQTQIHLAAVSTLDHIREFGDYRGALRLLNVLPNGQRVKAVAHWFSVMSSGKFIPKFSKEAKAYDCEALGKDRTDEHFQMARAAEVSAFDLTTEKSPEPMTAEALTKYLAAKANNTKTRDDGTPLVTPEARALAANLVAFIRSASVQKAA